MSRHIFASLILAQTAFLGAVSCSVKEDRTECPCYLEVDFMDPAHIKDPVCLHGADAEGGSVLFTENVVSADYPEGYIRSVRKGWLDFGTCQALSQGSRLHGDTVVIDEGSQCDSVYTFCERVDCTGELARVEVNYHKQFATVYMGFQEGGSSAVKSFDFLVQGNGCGTRLLSYEGVEGLFRFRPTQVSGNAVTFRLPRQMDDSLTVTLSSGDDRPMTLPLGQYVAALGYNWQAMDLQDIYITFDIISGKINVGVADWEVSGSFDMGTVEF